MTSLTLHYHPLSSYCWKALIAFYENATVFTPCQVDLGDPEAHAAFARIWPMARFPVLQDAVRGVTLPESSAIIEYLSLHYPGGFIPIPPDPDTAIEVRMMDRIFDNYVMTPMQAVVADRLRPAGAHDPHGVTHNMGVLKQACALLEARLSGRTWAAGDAFTLADCAAMPALYYAEKVAPFRSDHPVLDAYMDRLLARPSVVRVLEEAQPYAHFFPSA